MKNLCGKSIPVAKAETDAYEVWQSGQWTWYVLKKWQADDHKPFARWFCKVVTPMTGPNGDLGDVYAADVMSAATKVIDRVPAQV